MMRRSVRVNTRKISVEEFKQKASQNGWKLEPVPWCLEGFYIDRPQEQREEIALGSLQEHEDGLIYIQEGSSMFPPQVVDFEEGEVILDASCAPGSKLTQIANRAPDSLVIGNEPKQKRLIATTTNLERLGIDNVILTQYDASYFAKITPNSFDKVFLDAPCSNIHTLSDADKVSQRKIKYMAGIQKRLIKEAFVALKPGGYLIYSTCTVSHEENEENVKTLLKKFPQAKLEPINLEKLGLKSDIDSEFLPGTVRMKEEHYGSEIFYIALIKKEKTTPVNFESRKIFNWNKCTIKQKTDPENYHLEYVHCKWVIPKAVLKNAWHIVEKITPKWIGIKK